MLRHACGYKLANVNGRRRLRADEVIEYVAFLLRCQSPLTRTFRDVRIRVAIRCKVDLEQTAPNSRIYG
jgi:hypothetical protein